MLNKYIQMIKNDLNYFNDFKVTHVQRDRNKEANILSKWACMFEVVHEFQLEDFRNLLEDDMGKDFMKMEISRMVDGGCIG